MTETTNKPPYTVAGYLARDHGLNGLQALLNSDRYSLVALFTHRLLPKSEDPQRGERPEFTSYQQLCQQHDVPLWSIDRSKEVDQVGTVLAGLEIDLNVSISWRFLIPKEHLSLATIGGVNLHRGRLPKYAGAEPVKRMLLDGVADACIAAHVLDEEIDAGEVLREVNHPMTCEQDLPLDDRVEQVKRELTPYFGPLLIESLDALVNRYEQQNG